MLSLSCRTYKVFLYLYDIRMKTRLNSHMLFPSRLEGQSQRENLMIYCMSKCKIYALINSIGLYVHALLILLFKLGFFYIFFFRNWKKGIAFKNCPTLNNPCLRNCVFIFKVTSLLSDYFFLLTVKQIAYLPYFHNESSQAQDTVAGSEIPAA